MPPQQPVEEIVKVEAGPVVPRRVPLLLRVLRAEILRRHRLMVNGEQGILRRHRLMVNGEQGVEEDEVARERERRMPLLIRLFLGPNIARDRREEREQRAAEEQRREEERAAREGAPNSNDHDSAEQPDGSNNGSR